MIIRAANAWGHKWARSRILFHCDSKNSVDAFASGYSGKPLVAALLRQLHFLGALHGFVCRVQHIAGVKNGKADAISRNLLQVFRALVPTADAEPTPEPPLEDLEAWAHRQ